MQEVFPHHSYRGRQRSSLVPCYLRVATEDNADEEPATGRQNVLLAMKSKCVVPNLYGSVNSYIKCPDITNELHSTSKFLVHLTNCILQLRALENSFIKQ